MALVVVLVRPEGPYNVGGVARLCGNFGAELRLVSPLCDVNSTDAQKMAHPCQVELSAAPRFADLDAALADVAFSLATSGKIAPAVHAPALDVARARLLTPAAHERLALVFGNERTGLAKEEAARCTRVVRLPTPGPVDSLNLTSAVAVTLTVFAEAQAELARAATDGRLATRATRDARDVLEARWTAALGEAGFYRTTTAEAFAPRLRELLDKMDLSDRDTELLGDMVTRLGRR